MGTLKLQAVGVTTYSSSSSLANSASVLATGSTPFDNTTVLAPAVDLGLSLTFDSAPTPGIGILVGCYLIPRVDGTNPATVDLTTPIFPFGTLTGNFRVVVSSVGPQYLTIPSAPLSALKYDIYLNNQSGQSITAWTLTIAPTEGQY